MSDATLSLFGTEPGWLVNPETKLERRFARWAKDNPDVLAEFERRALALHRAGQRRIGVKQVAEVIRYYAAVERRGERYKVNNSYTACIARWLIFRHPELADAIETRRRAA
jgi:hypothetical protein